jgi:TolB-like protein
MRVYILGVFLALMTVSVYAEQYEAELASMAKSVSQSLEKRPSKTIAVLDFTDLQGKTTELGRFLAEELSATLVTSGSGLEVIDRANLDRLLDENKLQRSGLVDPENIKRLGRIAGVSALVIGTYTPLSGKLRVQARVIETDTAKIVTAARGNIELTPDIKDLLNTRIFMAGGTIGADGSASDNSQPSVQNTQRLIQTTPQYSVIIASAQFDVESDMLIIHVEYKNTDKAEHCLALSSKDPLQAVTYDGDILPLKKAVGIKTIREDDKTQYYRSGSPTNWTSVRDFTVVPPGAVQRFSLLFSSGNINSESKLNLNLNLVRGDYLFNKKDDSQLYIDKYTPSGVPKGCNHERYEVPALAVVFNGISPSI